MADIKNSIRSMRLLLEEISAAKNNFAKVASELDSIDSRYQKGEFDYRIYTQIKKKLLANKTSGEVMSSYRNYINSVKERLLEENSRIFENVYNERSYELLAFGKEPGRKTRKSELPSIDTLEIGITELPEESIDLPKTVFQKPAVEAAENLEEGLLAPKPEQLEIFKAPKHVRLGFLKRLAYAFQAKEKPWLESHEQKNIVFGGLLSKEFIDYLLTGKEKKRELFGETQIMPTILSYGKGEWGDRDIGASKTDALDPYLLEKEIKELKSLISKKKPDIYKASALGYVSNLTVRMISIYFIERFPVFFKRLYHAVRHSNIKILVNTYINIMFFITFLSGMLSIPFFTVIFAFHGDAVALVIGKTLLYSMLTSALAFSLAYYYPFEKAKSRRRSINTNLPFAIDHMSSVIASGVSPSTMFKLISTSSEYGEISVELEKVTHYVDFFGYDILTALKAVALITPSESFKEFLDGFVATIETGGDLKEYLAQRSGEALLNYRLERQKYVESLSTYSDIYTGVLIAAPLFFVTALSLVSVIGGNLGGMSITTLITVGTYIAIPILNVLFLVFLEINQPEI